MENSIKHLLFDSLPFEAFSKTAPMKLTAGLQNAASSFQGQRKHHVTQRRNKSRSKRSFGFIAGFTSHANRRGNDLSEAGWLTVLMMVTSQRRPDTHRYTQIHTATKSCSWAAVYQSHTRQEQISEKIKQTKQIF